MRADANLRVMVNAGVIDRFVNRFVRVFVLGVFAHHGDAHFVLRIAEVVQQVLPIARSPAGPACRPSLRTMIESSPFSIRLSGTS